MSDTSAAAPETKTGTYDARTREPHWYAVWERQGVFQADVDASRTPYTVVIPPPNVTGVLHMGHMLNNTIQDVLIRRKRQQGYNALWVPGTDHASIATEAKVVRLLREQGVTKAQLLEQHGEAGRDEFLKHAWAWKEKYGGIITEQLRRIGASLDWRRERFTMEEDLSKSVIASFVDLYRKGLIYRAERMVNWDPVGKTALSDEEVIYKDRTDQLYHVRYRVQTPLLAKEGMGEVNADTWITIATTRPETILADTAIAVHPLDERYTHLHGAQIEVPLANRTIPLILDEAVDREFGTGALKVTPAHDRTDYDIYQRHPEIGLIDILNEDGTIHERAGHASIIGLDRAEARKVFARELKDAGHLLKTEDLHHSVGHSERTDAIIEPRLSLQWWVRMQHFADIALGAVDRGEVTLHPDRFLNTYRHWLLNIKDWCISRQLWWGHRIPAWYLPDGQIVVANTANEALAEAQKLQANLTAADLKQDEDVLDTWFSSWLWPMSVFDNPVTKLKDGGNADFSYFYPTATLVTAPEILFFWVARMIMAGYEYAGKPPFRDVYLTGIVRDKQGRKMSKSLGNSPDLFELLDRFTVDGVRAGMLFNSQAGNDIMFDDSLCEQGRNFSNKIWNALKLTQMWGGNLSADAPEPRQTAALDWIESRIAQVAGELEGLYGQFRLSEALMTVYKLIWDDFCAWFLELSKPAAGQAYPQALYDRVLTVFEQLMQLLHPFMPFVTEEVWAALRPRSERHLCALAPLPSFGQPDDALLRDMDQARELVSELRAFRAAKGISGKQQLTLHVRTATPDFFARIVPIVGRLAGLDGWQPTTAPVAGALALVVRGHELYIPADAAAVDLSAERDRLQQEIEYAEGFLRSVQAKLSNEKFVANAKPDLVERERQKQADAEAKLAALRQSLAALSA